jgi:hypothetical protein
MMSSPAPARNQQASRRCVVTAEKSLRCPRELPNVSLNGLRRVYQACYPSYIHVGPERPNRTVQAANLYHVEYVEKQNKRDKRGLGKKKKKKKKENKPLQIESA